ncbi:alpha/beta hydrolase [Pseudomaricurvus sp. HS19]|uniref:alpha/beta hydrolase n=1 Tax=Pseudomaricurvus sp. HS19 TaxID=2692626 RepID=UPI00136F4685|nr:alpha/beta hydrolase [Pseudomaricurvus sp. HS19]MYM61916.1 alpha/beta hydrolase fold domain-containing protein [Pseudomaricurvus sp. HS19]
MSYTTVTTTLSFRSKLRIILLRTFFKRLQSLIGKMSPHRFADLQLKGASGVQSEYCGLPQRCQVIGNVPGSWIGNNSENQRVILYLHGGAFLFPASARLQLPLLARLCMDLGASGFMPDYRLLPNHPFPAALDDCESAYQGLLNAGYRSENIICMGESAGGTLVLSLLHRLKRHNLPMPQCAVPISPCTDFGGAHRLPSRWLNTKREVLIPSSTFNNMLLWYVNAQDASHPEISPLFGDYSGFPPLLFVASNDEILRDDSLLSFERACESGVQAELKLWTELPHAFPIFEGNFPEAGIARVEIVRFIEQLNMAKDKNPATTQGNDP